MKSKEEVNVLGKPTFYAVLYDSFKKAALECGYALSIHGSMHSDMDLIAMAWTDDAKSVEELVSAINDCLGHTVWSDSNLENKTVKPHGRISYSLSIMGNWFIDLSIMPPKPTKCSDVLHKHYYRTTMDYKYCPHCGIDIELYYKK
jgi:hypothetical protein